MSFFTYHGWDELDQIGENYYFEGVDAENIKSEAKKWIDKYINGKEKIHTTTVSKSNIDKK